MWVRSLPAADLRRELQAQRRSGRPCAVRARDAAAPARAPDPAGRRADLSKNVLRGFTGSSVPRAAPEFREQGHVHRASDSVAAGRARVRRVPRGDRGAGGGRQPPPRDDQLDADRAAVAREPGGGDRRLQALRPADRATRCSTA